MRRAARLYAAEAEALTLRVIVRRQAIDIDRLWAFVFALGFSLAIGALLVVGGVFSR